jgi:DNA-binding transcriptional MocR family regulator
MLTWSDRFTPYARRIIPSAIRGLASLPRAADTISFGPGEPDPTLFPVDEVGERLAAIMAEPAVARSALQYGPTEGDLALRERLSGYMAAKGVACTPANILLTNGSQQALDLVVELLVQPGARVMAQSPCYPGALQIFSAHGAEIVPIAADAPRPALIYAMATFCNPTGLSLAEDERSDLVALAHGLDTVLVEDDPYEVLRYDGTALPPLLGFERSIEAARTIYLGTFSKSVAPGFRVGWIVAPSEVIDKLVLLKQSEDLQAGTLAQACLAGLFDFATAVHAPRLRDAYRVRRDTMLSALDLEMRNLAHWRVPDGGFFLWLTVPGIKDTTALLAQAALAGVTFVPGAAFHAAEGGENTLRLSFSAAPVGRIAEGVARLARVIRDI